jgi:tetratricopeptide (TPR) repeat protein
MLLQLLVLLLTSVTLMQPSGVPGQTPPRIDCAAEWTQTTILLERAVLADDAQTVKAVRAACLQAIASGTPAERLPLTRYAIAYADWRLSTNPFVAEREQNDLLDEAETQLQEALKLNDKFAEASGLMAGVLGMKIAKSPMKGMFLGGKSSHFLDQALALEPDNPRLLLQRGVSRYNTPAMFGGSLKEAETLLRKSLTLFEKEPADRAWPNWGRFDAHVWLGQALVKRGDRAGARAEYDRAAAIAPQSGWLRFVLVPQLEKAGK